MSARALRAAGAPLRLAGARARAAPGRRALVAIGVAVAVALLGTAMGAGTVTGEEAARQTLERLPPEQRDLRVGWSGGLTPDVARRARATLSALTPAALTRAVLFLTTRATSGPSVQLGAVAPLGRWLTLRSGRLPRTCTPRRCEVVQAGGRAVRRPVQRLGTTIVVVGRGVLTSTVPLGFVPPTGLGGASEGQRQAPLLVGANPEALDGLVGFSAVFRAHGWNAALDLGARPSWRLDALREQIERAANALSNADESFTLGAPTDALAASAARAVAARRRLLLVGAGAAALLGAFALLAAGLARRDLEAERARLRRHGAGTLQLVLLDAAEGLGPALVGVIVGGAAAVAVTAADARGSPVTLDTLLRHSLLGPGALLGALACWLVAGALIAIGARTWGTVAGRMADVAALGAATALVVALSRGGARAGDPGDPLPTLLVPMALLVAALVIARLAPAMLRSIERAARRGPLALRLAALGSARGSGRAALTVAMVALACALACFASAYRATLHRGTADQAAFRVPLDVTVARSDQLVAPLAVGSAQRWRALAGDGPVLPILRRDGSVPGAQAAIVVLGVPAAHLSGLRGWDAAKTSHEGPAVPARRFLGSDSTAPRGVLVRRGDASLDLRARAVGDAVDLSADLVGADGSLLSVPLGRAGPAARTVHAPLPAGAAGRTLVAVEAAEPAGLAATAGHARAESPQGSTTTQGRLVLRDLRIGGRTVTLTGWCGAGALRAPITRGSTSVAAFAFDVGGRAMLHPCPVTDRRPLPMLADPATARSAGRGGGLAIQVEDALLRARVVGTLRRVPSVPAEHAFAVADERALATALTASAPGSGQPDELWIGASPAAEARLRAAMRRPPFTALALRSRRALQERLRADPLAHALSSTLVIAAGAALVLAAVTVLLVTFAVLRDEGAELYELEAVGADPALLRADLRLRAALLAALGMLCGALVGLALLALVVDAVQLTATGTAAFPPLVVVVPWQTWLAGAGAFAAACAALVAAGTRHALAGSAPRPSPGVAP